MDGTAKNRSMRVKIILTIISTAALFFAVTFFFTIVESIEMNQLVFPAEVFISMLKFMPFLGIGFYLYFTFLNFE